MSGDSRFFGTGTGTAFDFMAAPLVGKTMSTASKTTPYLLGKYGGNATLGNWGRGRTFSRIMNESLGDVSNPGALYDTYGPYNTRSLFPYMSKATGRFVESPTTERIAINAAEDFANKVNLDEVVFNNKNTKAIVTLKDISDFYNKYGHLTEDEMVS